MTAPYLHAGAWWGSVCLQWCALRVVLEHTLTFQQTLLRTAVTLISTDSNAEVGHIVPSGKSGYSGSLCEEPLRSRKENLRNVTPGTQIYATWRISHEGALMLWESQGQNQTSGCFEADGIGTGCTIRGVILMPHFKADIRELSKLSRALGLTDNSRTSLYTRTTLIQSLL